MFDYNFHWRPVLKSLPDLLEASLVTLQVAVLSMIIGIVIGLLLSIIKLKAKGPLQWFASCWIELARNTPALFQLFLWIWTRSIGDSLNSIFYCSSWIKL